MRFKLAFVLSFASIALVTGSTEVPEVSVNGSWTWPHHKTTTTTPAVPPSPPSPPTTTTTTPPPTSTTTTPSPSPPPTTTTTPSPSPPPTTTTTTTPSPSPPPTTTTTTTTTPAPTPSPTPKPTPTPTPAPKHDYGNWTVTGTNGTCIMVQAVLSLSVKYPTIDKKEGQAAISIPNNALSNGTCSNSTQLLNIYWGDNQATLRFSKVGTSGQYNLANVTVTLVADNKTFVNISKDITKLELQSSGAQFATPLSYSYQCSAQKSVPLVNATNVTTQGSLKFDKLHLQAFIEGKEAKFGSPEDCDEDASDLVPIVVGCALAALIVVILGVYVYGRRSQSRGYVSM